MYDSDIEALCVLYEKKDFKSASRSLKIKEASLKAKIGMLEERYGVHILSSDKGEVLFTDAGKSLAEDASFIIKYANSAISKARMLEAEENFSLKIGTSFTTSDKDIMGLLEEKKDRLGSLTLRSVHFFSLEETLSHLESHVDILSTFYDERLLKRYALSAIEIGRERVMLAMSKGDELSSVPLLDIEDLYGRRLYIPKKGYLKVFDQLRSDILEFHKEIEIVSFDQYSPDLERKIEEEGAFLASFAAIKWALGDLMLKNVLWNYSTQYGIIYKRDASDKVRAVINALTKD